VRPRIGRRTRSGAHLDPRLSNLVTAAPPRVHRSRGQCAVCQPRCAVRQPLHMCNVPAISRFATVCRLSADPPNLTQSQPSQKDQVHLCNLPASPIRGRATGFKAINTPLRPTSACASCQPEVGFSPAVCQPDIMPIGISINILWKFSPAVCQPILFYEEIKT